MASKIRLSIIVGVLIFLGAAGRLLGDDAAITKNEEKHTGLQSDLPKSVDLRRQFKEWKLLPKSQGHRNTCSVFTTTAALEFAVSKHTGRGTRLSVEYLNWACNQVIHN